MKMDLSPKMSPRSKLPPIQTNSSIVKLPPITQGRTSDLSNPRDRSPPLKLMDEEERFSGEETRALNEISIISH